MEKASDLGYSPKPQYLRLQHVQGMNETYKHLRNLALPVIMLEYNLHYQNQKSHPK